MATLDCIIAFISCNDDETAAILEIIERTNAGLRAQHKSSLLAAAYEFSPPVLRVTVTAQTHEEAKALQEAFIAKAKARLTASDLKYNRGPVKSMMLKLFADNPGRDYTAREVADELGKKPHNILAVIRPLIREGVLVPTQKRPRGKFGTEPMAYKRS